MPGILKTHLYCYDDHRGFTEDVKKRFADQSKYNIVSFQTSEEFIGKLEIDKLHKYCKIAIFGLHETQDQLDMIEKLTKEVKKIDPKTGLILLGPPDRMEAIKKTVKFNIDSYIPKNSNTILRLHNTVKKLMSEYGIAQLRRKSRVSLYILLGFLVLTFGAIIVAYLRFPLYF
jgi:DNA-binding NarL/FixJ family response regulator